MEIHTRVARSATELAIARELFEEYARSLPMDLGYQGFASELEGLPGKYAPPLGEILLAVGAEGALGCVALRPLDPGIAEIKRLYVRPSARGSGLGRRLVEEILEVARRAGYVEVRLDTLASMDAAQKLYRSLGFGPIPPYSDNYVSDTRFYALRLSP